MSRTTPRRRLSAEQRRELIEQAATEMFAERGYNGASIDEIARRAGISPPVLYDHFSSKQELHRALLERHYADLREVWRENLVGEDPPERRTARAFNAWFAYVESHPYAWRMLFRDDSGDPEVEAIRRDVAARSRAAVLPLLGREQGVDELVGGEESELLEAAWEVIRGALQALALWWYEHRHVPRAQIVAIAMNVIWTGLERVQRGELWGPEA
ncbi:MAG TPA: TetR/AcrR family transcriptional regulator [Solirubrobacteraceae bacterium]